MSQNEGHAGLMAQKLGTVGAKGTAQAKCSMPVKFSRECL